MSSFALTVTIRASASGGDRAALQRAAEMLAAVARELLVEIGQDGGEMFDARGAALALICPGGLRRGGRDRQNSATAVWVAELLRAGRPAWWPAGWTPRPAATSFGPERAERSVLNDAETPPEDEKTEVGAFFLASNTERSAANAEAVAV